MVKGPSVMPVSYTHLDVYKRQLQYHFHDFNPNYIVNHAYDTAYYIFENNNPIKNGEDVYKRQS